MKYLVVIGRVLYSLIFLVSASGHFSPAVIGFAASKGVPAAALLVPLAGLLEMIGALSILIGFKAKWGAWLVVLFLIPVTLSMHAFWTVHDPMARQMDMAMFLKNVSLVGGAVLIAYFGSGPLSVDARTTAA